MEIMQIIGVALFTILIPFIAPSINLRLYEVNPDLFKKIKITKLSFLFKGTYGKGTICRDVKKYGVIIPMFVLQLMGYMVALLSILLVLLLVLLSVNTLVIAKIMIIIFGGWAIFCVIYTIILSIVSKKRDI